MSSENQRFRRGPQSVVSGVSQAGVKTQVGDLVMQIGNYVVPFSLLDVTTSGSGSGEGFSGGSGFADVKTVFLGVLIEGAASGLETSDVPCLIATDGVYEFAVPAGSITQTYPIGTPCEPVINSSSTDLYNDQLQIVAARTYAIALLARQAFSGDISVLVRIYSSIMGEPLT